MLCKDALSDSSCWEAQEKGRCREPFFCHQTPACQAPLTALSDHHKVFEREQGKRVDETQLG